LLPLGEAREVPKDRAGPALVLDLDGNRLQKFAANFRRQRP
jgi:hypothetical protein